jgi:hypothetical protein
MSASATSCCSGTGRRRPPGSQPENQPQDRCGAPAMVRVSMEPEVAESSWSNLSVDARSVLCAIQIFGEPDAALNGRLQ